MEFSRLKKLPEWTSGLKLHTFRNGDRCTIDPFGIMQAYVGKWSGKGRAMDKDGKWQETDVSMNNYQSLGGCSVMTFLQVGSGENSFREFGLLTYNTFAETYENGRLNNEIASSYVSFYGDYTNNQLQLFRKNPSTGEVIETTKYRLDNQVLFLEKWEIRNEVLIKVFEVALSVN